MTYRMPQSWLELLMMVKTAVSDIYCETHTSNELLIKLYITISSNHVYCVDDETENLLIQSFRIRINREFNLHLTCNNINFWINQNIIFGLDETYTYSYKELDTVVPQSCLDVGLLEYIPTEFDINFVLIIKSYSNIIYFFFLSIWSPATMRALSICR